MDPEPAGKIVIKKAKMFSGKGAKCEQASIQRAIQLPEFQN
jgi:hypothetical protein